LWKFKASFLKEYIDQKKAIKEIPFLSSKV